jgi:hypothetical protein
VEFSSLCHSHKLSRSWLLSTCPCSCPLWPGPACLFTGPGGIPLPPLWCSGHPTLFAMCLYIAHYSVSLFSPGRGWSVQGAMLIWPSVVCGSTVYRLAHLVVHVFPSRLVAGDWWWPRGPPGFSVQGEVEMLCVGWRCGEVSFASSWWPCLQGVSPASLQDFTLRGTLSASSL